MGVWQHQGDALHRGPVGDGPSGAALPPQFMQKKSPLYVLLKEDTVWSMEHLNRYINDKFHKTKGLPRDWVFTTFTVCVCPAHSVRGGDAGQDWVGGAGPQAGPWAGLPLGVPTAVGSKSPLLSLSQTDHSRKTKVTL